MQNGKKEIKVKAPSVPLIIPGLILLLAGSHWFSGATTVGWILLAAGLFPLVLLLLVLAVAFIVAIFR